MTSVDNVVVSKTRLAFWLSLFFSIIMVMALVITFFVLSFENGALDLRNVLFWMGLFALIAFARGFIGIFHLIRTIRVKEDRMVISYWFRKEVRTLVFSEIQRIDMKKETTTPFTGLTTSSMVTVIRLADETKIEFDNHQFENYARLKNAIYERWPGNSLE